MQLFLILIMFWVLPAAERLDLTGFGSCEKVSASVLCANDGLSPFDPHKPFCQTSWHYEFAMQIQ
ncbi:MAG: hypothetical protein SOV73_00550 [Candidatus Faecivivens sp.]|nr:hypothetical protein [Candidatus Faecivivens sp.]